MPVQKAKRKEGFSAIDGKGARIMAREERKDFSRNLVAWEGEVPGGGKIKESLLRGGDGLL